MPKALASIYAKALGIDGDLEALEPALQAALQEAQAAWPDLALPVERFVRHLALAGTPEQPLPDKLFAADVFLACACTQGVEGAAERFDQAHGAELLRTAQRIAPDQGDDVVQTLRARLMVGEGERPPMLATYAGRGSLKSWLRLSVTHAALKAKQRAPRNAEDDLVARLPSDDGDPELAIIKRTYRPHFNRALKASIGDLKPRQRRLLAQHFIDGVEVNQIAQLHNVHRTTASRWLSEARAALLEHLRGRLIEALSLSPAECDSLLRLVHGELEDSLRGCFLQGD